MELTAHGMAQKNQFLLQIPIHQLCQPKGPGHGIISYSQFGFTQIVIGVADHGYAAENIQLIQIFLMIPSVGRPRTCGPHPEQGRVRHR